MIACAKTPCACKLEDHKGKLVVLTGGPGGGKTAVLEAFRTALCEHVAILPEMASILFSGGFPRGDSLAAREAVQRTIFFGQRELEELALAEGNHAVILCDRGTIDGLAYWPSNEAALFANLGTTREKELSRYAAVIHLRTPTDGSYDHRNPSRIETLEQAARVDSAIVTAWRGHANRSFVEPQTSFVDKLAFAVDKIRRELPDCCRAHALPGATR